MNIELQRINDAVKIACKNERGNEIIIDGGESIGGQNAGPSPMELLLMGIGGCSSMDVLTILKKQKQDISSYKVLVNGNRVEDIPKVFDKIHVEFIFEGNVEDSKAARAIELSMTKYCSVTKMLEKSAEITWSHKINGK